MEEICPFLKRRLALPAPIREVVADQLAAAVSEDWRSFDKACPLLLWLLLAESHLTRRLFGSMQHRIAMVAPPVG